LTARRRRLDTVTHLQPAARPEPDPDQEDGDALATVPRRPVRTGTVLTQPPPPPPVPYRGSQTDDEPDESHGQSAPRPDAEVVADIDRLIAEVTTPPPDPGP
jgi:hypothetical protein